MISPTDSISMNKLLLTISPYYRNDEIENLKKYTNPFFENTKDIIRTESGYIIVVPEQTLGGVKTVIHKLGNGLYLVEKTLFNSENAQRIIMDEDELVEAFNGIKVKKDKKVKQENFLDKLLNPYDLFQTKHGYVIKLLNGNNITGAKQNVKALPDGTYLVTSSPRPGIEEKRILTEAQLVEEFDGEKMEIPEDELYFLIA
ncbi:hypothetical protein IJ472_03145 [bacterium]|nr:hypothetical protein [bacterium]